MRLKNHKTCSHVKSYDGQIKLMYFLLNLMIYLKEYYLE